MARRVKNYVAGAIPTTTEVSDLKSKVVQLEETDAAFKREMTDEVARDKRVEELTKEVMAKQSGTIDLLVKDVETVKDATFNADLRITHLGLDLGNVGVRADQAYDKASQNEGSIASINQALQVVEESTSEAISATNTRIGGTEAYLQDLDSKIEGVSNDQDSFKSSMREDQGRQDGNLSIVRQIAEKLESNVEEVKGRLNDLEADADATGVNFDQLVVVGVLKKPTITRQLTMGEMARVNNITEFGSKSVAISKTSTSEVYGTVSPGYQGAIVTPMGNLMVTYSLNPMEGINIVNTGYGMNITLTAV